jgi:transposase
MERVLAPPHPSDLGPIEGALSKAKGFMRRAQAHP